jgi:hypothetical protein
MKEDNDENVDKNWFKKHSETITVMLTLLGGFVWMDSKMDTKFDKVNERLSALEKDVAVIKTVLSLKGINCSELASKDDRVK